MPLPQKAAVAITLAHAASKGIEVARFKPIATPEGEMWRVELRPRRSVKARPGEFHTLFVKGDGKSVRFVPGK